MFSLGANPRFGYLPDIGVDADESTYINMTGTTMENDFEYNLYCSTYAAEVAKSYRYNIKTVSGEDMNHLRFILKDMKTWEEHKRNHPFKTPELMDIYSSTNLKQFSNENELSLKIMEIGPGGELTCIHQRGYPNWKKTAHLLMYSNRRNIPYLNLQYVFRDVDYHFLAIINWEKFKQSPLFQRSNQVGERREIFSCTFM